MNIRSIVACAALVLCVPAVAQADLQEEAERQLLFARGELEAGRFDAALKSSESAMRLSPGLYRAMVIKALALEGLGETKTAEAILIAYFELTKGITPDEAALAALNRLQAGGAPASSGTRSRPGEVLRIGEITADNQAEVAKRLKAEWTAPQFVLRYQAHCEDDGDEHEFVFENLGFYVRLDRGGEFKAKGADKYAEDSDRWDCDDDEGNKVAIFFDGERVWAKAAGDKHDVTWVRSKPANPDRINWRLKLTEGTRLANFEVAPWSIVDIEPIKRKRVEEDDLGDWADDLSDDWRQSRWHLSYSVTHQDRRSGHTIELPELGFYFRVEDEGQLVVRGESNLEEDAEDHWKLGGEPNAVELWFDGDSLSARVNGEDHGPWEVRESITDDRATKWVWKLKDDDDEFRDLVVERWTPRP